MVKRRRFALLQLPAPRWLICSEFLIASKESRGTRLLFSSTLDTIRSDWRENEASCSD